MIDFCNETEHDIDLSLIESIYSEFSEKELELILTDNDTIQEINKEHRSKDVPTDVLSFPMEDIPMMPIGSIIISLDKAKEMAQKYNHPIDSEITLLFIHGMLHLLGYDHEVDEGQMRDKEKELINKYNLPKSLIVRTESE
jgi:probable rRNA maturation factor